MEADVATKRGVNDNLHQRYDSIFSRGNHEEVAGADSDGAMDNAEDYEEMPEWMTEMPDDGEEET